MLETDIMMPGGGSMNNGNPIAATRVAVCGGKNMINSCIK